MKRYISLFETNNDVIKLFKDYYGNEREYGKDAIKFVNIFLKKGTAIQDKDIKYNPIGKRQDCETNSYKYAKQYNMQVVQGYTHMKDEEDENYWFHHSWIYDPINKKHIELTPLDGKSEGRIGRVVKKEKLKIALGKWGSLKDKDYEKI